MQFVEIKKILNGNNMLEKILNDVDYFDNIRKEILSTSPYYPEYIKKVDNNVIYYGTFVRIFRNDKWYKIPVLEMYFIGENGFEPIALLEKFIKQVCFVQYLYDVRKDFIDIKGNKINIVDELIKEYTDYKEEHFDKN